MKRLFEYVCGLNEMAVERKEYKRKLVDLQYQLIENWCLVWYASKTKNLNLNHWKNELGAVLYKIVTRKVKNSSQQSMYKLIKQTLIDEEELNNATTIKWLITSKFDKEHITYNLDIISNAFVVELPKIIMLISTSEPKNIKSYIDTL